MVKKPKFNLDIDGYPVKNLEDLQEHFHIEDVLMNFEDGRLARWLDSRGYDKEFNAVDTIDKSVNKKDVLIKLLEIFGIQNINSEMIEKILYPQITKEAYKNKPDIIQELIFDCFDTGYLQNFLNKTDNWADYGADIDKIDKTKEKIEITTELIDILFKTSPDTNVIKDSQDNSDRLNKEHPSDIKDKYSIYECMRCGYLFNESVGVMDFVYYVRRGTKWGNVPNSWRCPKCGAPKSLFKLKENDTDNKSLNKEMNYRESNFANKKRNSKEYKVFDPGYHFRY